MYVLYLYYIIFQVHWEEHGAFPFIKTSPLFNTQDWPKYILT